MGDHGFKHLHLPSPPQEIQATWYEKLHEWEDALQAYGKKIELAKEEPDLILGRMRCLEALGEWCVWFHSFTVKLLRFYRDIWGCLWCTLAVLPFTSKGLT